MNKIRSTKNTLGRGINRPFTSIMCIYIVYIHNCSCLLFYCCHKHHEQMQNEEEKAYFILQVTVYHIGKPRQELKARP